MVYKPIFMACDEARVSEAEAEVPEVEEQTEIFSVLRPNFEFWNLLVSVFLLFYSQLSLFCKPADIDKIHGLGLGEDCPCNYIFLFATNGELQIKISRQKL